MNDEPKFCKCGKDLWPGETVCPACKTIQRAWWVKVGSSLLAALMFVASIALSVVTRGKFKLKA